jgi:diguanylate cyclase (GGDEF)-like protein/PAS domain S-box-containing protein
MQPMNMTTLLLALSMIGVATAAFTWFLYFYNRGVVGTLAIAGSNTCFALGFGMIAFRVSLGGFLSFIVANSLIFIAHILIIVGIQRFFGRRTYPLISILLFACYMAAFSYWYYVENNFPYRLVIFLTTYATMMLFGLWLMLSEYRKACLSSYLVSALFIGFLSVLFYASAIISVFSQHGVDILDLNTLNLSIVFEQILFLVGWTLSFSLMVSERLYAGKSIAERRFRALVEGAPDGILVYDADLDRLVDANVKAEQMFACDRAELLRAGPQRFFAPVQADASPPVASFEDSVALVLSGASCLIERDLMDAQGRTLSAEVRLSRLPSASSNLIRGSFLDVSDRKEAKARLQFLATHDVLTELPNRLLLTDRVEQALLAAERMRTKAGFLFCDVDGFKVVNDTYGHQVGDHLLKAVAQRLCECVRKMDTVSRHGGDEFMVLLTQLPNADGAKAVASHILDAFKEPFRIDGMELFSSASIGIAMFPDDGNDYETLRKKADLAMYHAKEDGKNTSRFYDSSIDTDEAEHHRLMTELRGALTRKELELHYQPQFSLKDGRLVGAEALLRWNHPVRGMVTPASFIPLAESSGLIVDIGAWVLREACRQAAAWHADGVPGLVVAVNLSAVQFRRDNLVQTVADAIAAAGISPDLLELELTESILIRDTDQVLATVTRLRSLGVKLSIDDFGTGYSSLSYLKRFNVDKVKIDQSFIKNIDTDPSDATIVRSICAMVHGLNLTVIAEGVEKEEQLEPLREYSCDEAQGYLYARPMPPAEFSARMIAWASGRFQISAAPG